MNGKMSIAIGEDRIKIQEKALSNLADSLNRYESASTEELRDIRSELKAIKLFLSRSNPDFKKQFPEIQRKLK